MYTEFYEKISAPWRNRDNGAALLARIDEGLRAVTASAYCIVLLWLFLNDDGRLLQALAVPATVLVLATVLRAALNKPRPYEAHDIQPLIHKDTVGKSMPSRHMASATAIAATLWWANPLWGAVGAAGNASAVGTALWGLTCVLLACAVGYVRVAGGVHFPRDIAAGAALALACALAGFTLIP